MELCSLVTAQLLLGSPCLSGPGLAPMHSPASGTLGLEDGRPMLYFFSLDFHCLSLSFFQDLLIQQGGASQVGGERQVDLWGGGPGPERRRGLKWGVGDAGV